MACDAEIYTDNGGFFFFFLVAAAVVAPTVAEFAIQGWKQHQAYGHPAMALIVHDLNSSPGFP